MWESFTAASLRAIERAGVRAGRRGAAAVEPADLLAALVDESESRAAEVLAEFGFDAARVLGLLGAEAWEPAGEGEGEGNMDETPPGPEAPPHSSGFRAALNDAV